MLASTVGQSSDTDNQRRTANLLTLNTSGIHHEPVLLSAGKWMIGSADSNQIVLNDERIAQNQFLIIVTEHRSIIKDWSGTARWNGTPFDNAVLSDGDVVQIADIQLTFRLAENRDLISQLPCVADPADPDNPDSIVSDRLSQYAKHESTASQNDRPMLESDADETFSEAVHSRHVESRLDGLIARIGSTSRDDLHHSDESINNHGHREANSDNSLPILDTQESDLATLKPGTPADSDPTETDVNQELKQLEEVRAAVRLEREQLLAKRKVLAQETINVHRQFDELNQDEESKLDDAKPPSECTAQQLPVSGNSNGEAVGDVTDTVPLSNNTDTPNNSTLDLHAIDEPTEVIAEREKLRHYLEEFDSSDEASTTENEEAVAVGAAQLSTEETMTNAMRTRDDAVRELDDLILAATRSSSPESGQASTNPISGYSGNWPPQGNDGLLQNEYQAVALPADQDQSDVENVDIEASVEDLGALVNEVVSDGSDLESNGATVDIAERVTDYDYSQDQSTYEEVAGNFTAPESTIVEHVNDETLPESREFASTSQPLTSGSDVSFGVTSDEDRTELDNHSEDDDHVGVTSDSGRMDQCETIDDVEVTGDTESVDVFNQQEQGVNETVAKPPVGVPEDSIFGTRLPVDTVPSQGDKVEASDSNPLTDASQVEHELPENNEPSWFDSKLMSDNDSDSAAEFGEYSAEAEDSDCTGGRGDAEPTSASQPEEDTAGDLRKKLAEMFDLPTPSENNNTTESDSSAEEQTRRISGEGQSEETEDRQPESVSLWRDAASFESIDELDDSVADSERETNADVESEIDYGSETLDQFPTSQDEGSPDDESQIPEQGGTSQLGVQSEEDSISDYMERLLARNRKITGASASTTDDSITSNDNSSFTSSHRYENNTASDSSEPGNSTTESNKAPETWLEETPRHRLDRDQVRAEVDVLRQIANQSARSAVATASLRNIRKQVVVKTIASVLAISSGVAALLLDVSLVFGMTVSAIGVVFSADLALTVFRNWKQTRDIRKAAAVLTGSSDDPKNNSTAQPE